jgi:hypothetical protein
VVVARRMRLTVLCRNSLGGRIGIGAKNRSTKQNAVRLASPNPNKRPNDAEYQENRVPPPEIATRMRILAARIRKLPMKSTFRRSSHGEGEDFDGDEGEGEVLRSGRTNHKAGIQAARNGGVIPIQDTQYQRL